MSSNNYYGLFCIDWDYDTVSKPKSVLDAQSDESYLIKSVKNKKNVDDMDIKIQTCAKDLCVCFVKWKRLNLIYSAKPFTWLEIYVTQIM